MHIVLISQQAWTLPSAQALARQHRITPLQGSLADVQARARQARPDLVLLRDFAQTDELIAQVEALCAALPGMALVLLCPDPAPAFLMGVMRAGVREVMPSDDEASLAGLIERTHGRRSPRPLPAAQGRCIGVMPAKGGDGASCVAAHLAAAVASQPTQRVLLMDLSLPFGDVELFLTSEPVMHDLADVSGEIERLDAALLEGLTQHVAPSLHVIGSPSSLEKYLQLKPDHVLRLVRLAQRHYDLVILDLGLDAIGLGALDVLDQLVVVGRMSLPSVKGASHLVALWGQLGHAPDKLVLALRREGALQDIRPADVEAAVGRRVTRFIPQDDEAVAASLAQGRPATQLKPRSAFSPAMAAWAAELTGLSNDTPSAPKSLWHRLRIR